MAYFNQVAHDISPKSSKKVKSIMLRLFISDCTGTVYFTDIFVQAGKVATGWVGHVSEIKWTMDG